MTMNLTRREFLVKGTALLAALGLGVPLLSKEGLPLFAMSEARETGLPVLVAIQLSGGNDGLNTVIPYGIGGYYDARPTLNITQSEVLSINNQLGFHPSMGGLHELYRKGKVAVVQGVGYPKPDHSHFRSMEIWQTAAPEKYERTGWLARYLETSLPDRKNRLTALQIGNNANKAFYADTVNVPVVQSLESYNFFDPKTMAMDRNRLSRAFLDMYDQQLQAEPLKVTCRTGMDAYQSVEAIHALDGGYQSKIEYPNSGFAKDLQTAAKMLAAKSGTRVFYVQLGGFDDHAQEKEQHARLLKELDAAVTAFYQDLEAHGLQDQVVTMAFSEFGRRVKENGSGGTDHGTAAPVLVLGGKVKGGLYGETPNLLNLDKGDLKYAVDFRSVYYTMIEDWMKGDAKAVLGKTYEKLAIV